MAETITSTRQGVLTEWEVQELVYTWYRKITLKAPLEEMLAMLSPDRLEMRFPEGTLRSHAEFERWYETVKQAFFDQVHDVLFLSVDVQPGHADVRLIVNWQARTWKAPAANSVWQGAYVHQRWQVLRDPHSGKALISLYEVGAFDPMPPA